MAAKLIPTLLLIDGVVLALTSLLCLAFKATSYNKWNTDTQQGLVNGGIHTSVPEGSIVWIHPTNLRSIAQGVVIAAAVISFVVSMGIVAIAIKTIKKALPLELVRSQRLSIYSAIAANAAIATAVMIYLNTLFASDNTLTAFEVANESDYTFTLETWACRAPTFVPELAEYGLHEQCTGEEGSRMSLILMSVFAIASVLLVFCDARTSRSITTDNTTRSRGWEEDDNDSEADVEMKWRVPVGGMSGTGSRGPRLIRG